MKRSRKNTCTEALEDAFNEGPPTIFNTDQGSQFTSTDFTDILKNHNVQISMDGKGRYLGFNKYKHQKQDPIAQPGKLGDEINE